MQLTRKAGAYVFLCRIVVLVLLPLMLLPVPSAAQEPSAGTTEMPRLAFTIPPQALSSGLVKFSEITNLELLVDSGLTQGIQTPGVSGEHSSTEALQLMLVGTGLTYRFVDSKTVTLERDSSSAVVPGVIGAAAVGAGAVVAMDGTDQPDGSLKPVRVPEILVKDIRQRDEDTKSYVAEEASTATRTDTPLIEVPQNVQVVTQKVIQDQRAVRLEQALRNVSGVVTGVSEGGATNDTALCRGFPCGYFKNNLRNEDSQQVLYFRDVANIQRLEVLKGPASVLYGRSEPGGIINIMTKQPQAERYNSIEQIFGSYNYYRTMVDSTGALDKDRKLLYRLNAAYENKQSYRDFIYLQRYFVAPVFTWIAGNNTTITIEGEYIHDKTSIDSGFPAIGTGIASLPRNRNLGEPFTSAQGEEGRVSLRVNHRFNDRWHIESQFRTDQGSKDGLSVQPTALQANNQTLDRFFSQPPFDIASYYWRNDLIGKVSTGSIQHKLLTGVELGRQTTNLDFAFAPFGSIDILNPVYNQTLVPNVPPTPFSRVFANSAGGYVQDEVTLFDNLHILIGARGDYFYQNATVSNVVTKAEDWGFSPRIGVSYKVIPQVAVYANVTRSFQPVFGPFSAASNVLKPTTAMQYEAGIKTDIVPGRLTSTLALYQIDKKDVPVQDPNGPFGFLIQTGAQRSQGFEFDLRAQLLPGWNVIATYAYTDARVTADTAIPVGNRLPLVAMNTGSVWSTYDFPVGLLQGFGVGGGVFAVGERAGDINNSFELPGYVRADAALYYRKQEIMPRTNLIAQVNIQNLSNQEYFYGGFQTRGASGLPGAPISVFGSVKLEFY